MKIFCYDPNNNYFTGDVADIGDDDPIPMCWTTDPVPEIPDGQFARFNCPGWVLTEMEPPIPPVEQPRPEGATVVNEPPVVI